MIPDRFAIHATVPRELYEDTSVLETYLRDCWMRMLLDMGGTPNGDSGDQLRIQTGLKTRDGQDILPFMDDTGWDYITVRVVGPALRPGGLTESEGDGFGWSDAATWAPGVESE
jgi:hypothetical protein